MEGLIPLVCKSIKRNGKWRKYECISSRAAQSHGLQAHCTKEADDESHSFNFIRKQQHLMEPAALGSRGAYHRCYSSMDHLGSSNMEEFIYEPKKLVRFNSHRMFSCLNGA